VLLPTIQTFDALLPQMPRTRMLGRAFSSDQTPFLRRKTVELDAYLEKPATKTVPS
jgi:hypothetical protein